MLSFDFEWLEGSGVRGPELAATWATLEVKAGDSTVTRVLDRRARTVRDFVFVPLYPLAEWLVTNWWFLTHEMENPLKAGDPGFRRRHALADNREGYALPCLEATPSGNRTRLSWEPDRPPSTTVEFLEGGQTWVDSGEFRESCAALVDRVVGRLTTLGVDDTFLEQECDGAVTHDDAGHPAFALRSLREDNRRFLFCRALAPAMDWSGSDTLLTKARSEQQQRNRAFAAEFLVPAESLRQRVPHAVVDGHDIDELAATFGVSDWVIRHQLVNHRIAQVW